MEEPTGITEQPSRTAPTGALHRAYVTLAQRQRALSVIQRQIYDLERNYELMSTRPVRVRGRPISQESQQQAMEDILEELRDLGAYQMNLIDDIQRFSTNIDRYGDTMTDRDLVR